MRFLIFFLFSFTFSFSQSSQTDLDIFYKKVNDFCLGENEVNSFCIAFRFYRSKSYDSCYVYSGKLLNNMKSGYMMDVLNYIQGISAIEKKLYKKAKQNFNDIPNSSSLNNFRDLQLGIVDLNLKKYDEAINNYLKWETYTGKLKDTLYSKIAYHNLGLCYIHKRDYQKAKEYFDKELNLIVSKDTLSLIRAKMDLANVYYNQYLDNEAIPLFKEAYDLAKVFSNIKMKQQTSQNMAVVERNRKSFEASANYYKETLKLKDSLYNRDKIWELTEKDKQLAIAQKQSEIVIQDEKLKRQKVQRDGLMIGLVGLLVFIGGLGFLYKKLQSQNRFITKQKEALNTANKTKDYLFSVVSHDLRSPINTIKKQHTALKEHIAGNNLEAITEVNNKAIAVTESTSHLLNNVLHWSLEQSNQLLFSPQEIALRPTVEHVLYDYTMLVEANNINIASELENAIVKVDKESIKIVLRNVLDNAVKYGGKEILVTTGISEENKAFIKVKDSGIGIPKEKLVKINALTNLSIDKIDRAKGIGLGVVLCHTLVKKNNGILTFASEPNDGTTVTIELPNVEV